MPQRSQQVFTYVRISPTPQTLRHSYTQNKKRFGINKQQSYVQLGSTAGATDVLKLLADEEDRVVGVLEHVPRVLIIVGPHVPLLVQELEPHVLNTLLASKPKSPLTFYPVLWIRQTRTLFLN